MHPLRKLRESGNPTPAQVSELLAENIVFNSPIRRSRGVKSSRRFSPSRALRVVPVPIQPSLSSMSAPPSCGWVGTMDGRKFESLGVIVDNEQGLIVERTIALRPFPALKLFRDAMYAALKDKLPPDVWDYPTQ